MNPIKSFFTVDIPAVFSAGKWRLSLMQLKNKLAQLENQKPALLDELGAKAWQGRVRHASYDATFVKFEALEGSVAQAQQEIDSIQKSIDQESGRLNAITADFNGRSKEVQDQRQPAMQRLGEFQAQERSIQERLSQLQASIAQGRANLQNMQKQANQIVASTDPDRETKVASLQSTIATVSAQVEAALPQVEGSKAELESAQASQKPIRDEIDGYDQLMKMLQEQCRVAMAPIQDQIRNLQQALLKANEKKAVMSRQITAQFPDLGKQVFKFKPAAEVLSAVYGQLDALENEIKRVNDEVNLTNARLASIGSRSVQKVLFVGGGAVLAGICLFAAAAAVPPIARLFKPDPKSSVSLVQSWALENCVPVGSQGGYIDVSVWENRRGDATANAKLDTQLLGSNNIVLDSVNNPMEIGPGGSALNLANLDPGGSRVQGIKRTITSVYFTTSKLGRPQGIQVATFFEKSKYSNNITLGVEITNKSDFGLSAGSGSPMALVLNSQNQIIDIQGGFLADQQIPIDSLSRIAFEGAGSYVSGTCLQSDYSQDSVTFWYFVPLQVSTGSSDQITLSGKVPYMP